MSQSIYIKLGAGLKTIQVTDETTVAEVNDQLAGAQLFCHTIRVADNAVIDTTKLDPNTTVFSVFPIGKDQEGETKLRLVGERPKIDVNSKNNTPVLARHKDDDKKKKKHSSTSSSSSSKKKEHRSKSGGKTPRSRGGTSKSPRPAARVAKVEHLSRDSGSRTKAATSGNTEKSPRRSVDRDSSRSRSATEKSPRRSSTRDSKSGTPKLSRDSKSGTPKLSRDSKSHRSRHDSPPKDEAIEGMKPNMLSPRTGRTSSRGTKITSTPVKITTSPVGSPRSKKHSKSKRHSKDDKSLSSSEDKPAPVAERVKTLAAPQSRRSQNLLYINTGDLSSSSSEEEIILSDEEVEEVVKKEEAVKKEKKKRRKKPRSARGRSGGKGKSPRRAIPVMEAIAEEDPETPPPAAAKKKKKKSASPPVKQTQSPGDVETPPPQTVGAAELKKSRKKKKKSPPKMKLVAMPGEPDTPSPEPAIKQPFNAGLDDTDVEGLEFGFSPINKRHRRPVDVADSQPVASQPAVVPEPPEPVSEPISQSVPKPVDSVPEPISEPVPEPVESVPEPISEPFPEPVDSVTEPTFVPPVVVEPRSLMTEPVALQPELAGPEPVVTLDAEPATASPKPSRPAGVGQIDVSSGTLRIKRQLEQERRENERQAALKAEQERAEREALEEERLREEQRIKDEVAEAARLAEEERQKEIQAAESIQQTATAESLQEDRDRKLALLKEKRAQFEAAEQKRKEEAAKRRAEDRARRKAEREERMRRDEEDRQTFLEAKRTMKSPRAERIAEHVKAKNYQIGAKIQLQTSFNEKKKAADAARRPIPQTVAIPLGGSPVVPRRGSPVVSRKETVEAPPPAVEVPPGHVLVSLCEDCGEEQESGALTCTVCYGNKVSDVAVLASEPRTSVIIPAHKTLLCTDCGEEGDQVVCKHCGSRETVSLRSDDHALAKELGMGEKSVQNLLTYKKKGSEVIYRK